MQRRGGGEAPLGFRGSASGEALVSNSHFPGRQGSTHPPGPDLLRLASGHEGLKIWEKVRRRMDNFTEIERERETFPDSH